MSWKSIVGLVLVPLVTGCMREELPVPRAPRGDAREVQVCLGQGYQQQLWMDLASGDVVRSNSVMAWDLAFESASGGWRIMLNGGRLMKAQNTGIAAIDAAVDPNTVLWQGAIDAPSGHPDSTAFGDWRPGTNLFLVDMGYDAAGNQLGVRRVRPLSVGPSGYTVEVAQADGSGAVTYTVPRDPQRTWVHFSFAQGVVQVAPPDGSWDFVLTRYTHIFRDFDLPYLVVGALTDGRTVRVAMVPDASFDAVQLADTLLYPFTTSRDAIGYDWKDYSFDTNAYEVDVRRVYIVRSADGLHHKLRFLEFYGPQGQPGCPLMQVQAL